MNSKPAAFPLFPDSYLGDTQHLDCEEHGAYLLLLLTAWMQDDCGLPNDDRKLARIARLSAHKWRRIKPTVLAFWTMADNDRLYQKRQLRERAYVEERSRQAREAADVRWGRSPDPDDEGFSQKGRKIPGRKGPQKPAASGGAQVIENAEADECGRICGEVCETDAPPPPPHTRTSPSERTRARGKNGKARKGKAEPLSAEWQPDAADAEMLSIISGWPRDRFERELAQFRDHAAATGRRLADWQAGFRTWLRNADDRTQRRRDGGDGLLNACRDRGTLFDGWMSDE